jgi:hypothetical protein
MYRSDETPEERDRLRGTNACNFDTYVDVATSAEVTPDEIRALDARITAVIPVTGGHTIYLLLDEGTSVWDASSLAWKAGQRII